MFKDGSVYSAYNGNEDRESWKALRGVAWREPDYACATDVERERWALSEITVTYVLTRNRMVRDLPVDLNHMVTSLSKHANVQIYAMATWRDENDMPKYYEYVPRFEKSMF